MKSKTKRRARRSYTAEFKADAVKLVQGGRSVSAVARDLELTPSALREWVKRAEADAGVGDPSVLTTDERVEMARLRREVKKLRMEREILKAAATAYLAQSEHPARRIVNTVLGT